MASIHERLIEFSPREFEHVIYDLVVLLGMRNVVWRTPGADGGRDIEGFVASNDFSGAVVSQKWFVECKRYASSIDWPTVWNKLAFADNQGADYLLLATTASPSPACKTEISQWNSGNRHPKIRFWDAASLERIIGGCPQVLAKYSLTDGSVAAPALMQLAKHACGVMQAAYTADTIAKGDSFALEAAAALSELLTARVEQIESGERFAAARFRGDVDGFDWVKSRGEAHWMSRFDRHGLRAFFAMLRYVLQADFLEIFESGRVRISTGSDNLRERAFRVLHEIAHWGFFEVRHDDGALILEPRDA